MGSPSRGWPTAPGLTMNEPPVSTEGTPNWNLSKTAPSSSERHIMAMWVWPIMHMGVSKWAKLAAAVSGVRTYSHKEVRSQDELRKSEEAQRRLVQEAEVLAEIGRTISSSLNIDEVYERFAEHVHTVTITISPDSQVSVSTTTLTFTTADWASPQTATVSAVDDGVVENPHTGTITHSAAGGAYDGVSISSIVANVTDDDASVTITETAASTDVTEGGATDTYDVVLDLQPTGTVTIIISPDSQVNVSTTTLTFTTGDWDTPRQ